MNILFVQKMAGVAGAERYYENLLPALVRNGHHIHFLSVEPSDSTGLNDAFCLGLEQHGVKVHRVQFHSIGSPFIVRKIVRVVADCRIDILQTNLIHADLWGAAARPFLAKNVAWISVKHGYSPHFQAQHGFDATKVERLDGFHLATRTTSQLCDQSVAISESLCEFLIKSRGVSAANIVAIPYGFDFHSQVASKGDFQSDLVVVGRLVPVKQHHLLLQAMVRVCQVLPKVQLAIVGGGELRSELESLCERLGIAQNVTFHGFQDAVFPFLNGSKISIFPSKAEGFGLVLLESWFCKKPVVSFDVPAINELIDDAQNGILIPCFDVEALAERLIQLLQDEQLRQEMGAKGHAKYLFHYSLNAMLARYEELYELVASKKLSNSIRKT